MIGGAYPAWPDLVEDYRNHRTPLEELWAGIAQSVDQTLTALTHAQAAADAAASHDADLSGTVLDSEPLRSLAATRIYLAEPWSAIVESFRSMPLNPVLGELRGLEERVTMLIAEQVLEVWRRLGLSIDEGADRQWSLCVDEPMR